MNDISGGNKIWLCWSRLRVVTLLFMLSLLALPIYAQNNKEVEKAKNRNETLKQQIKALVDENTSLQNRIEENKKQLQQKQNYLQDLKAQNEATNISPEQINALQNKVDSLERDNNSLKKVKVKKADELYGLHLQVSEMGVYSDIETKQRYEQNQTLFSKRYSELTPLQVNNVVRSLEDFKNMVGYAEYKKKVKFMERNRNLYEECIGALNSKYNDITVQQLRDQLLPLRENKENKEQGIFKLNTEQFNEMDSLDIKLSRFKGGLRELQTIIEKVNKDPEIAWLRSEGKNRQQCVEAMRKYLETEPAKPRKEWKNQNVVERYFNMVSYLSKAYQTYKRELSDNPFNTTNIEKEILSYNLQ